MSNEQKNLELGPLAYFSHELRTPLNAILGYTDLMTRQIHGPMPTPYKDFLEGIHTSGQHLLSMINNILDYAKIQSGSMTIHAQAVDLKKSVKTCLKILSGLASDKKINIEFHAEQKLPLLCLDETLTRQIIVNLVANAIKFSPKSSKINVNLKHDQDGGILLEICDEGVGMAEDMIELALKPFGQIPTHGKKKEGTGLGLPLVKAIIDLHKAKLSIKSELGKGTTICIHFPKELREE